MTTESPAPSHKVKHAYHHGGDAIYAIGIFGAAFYFIEHATTIWMGALGLVKAVFWPAFVVYRVLELLKF
jgi:hypothetical protein